MPRSALVVLIPEAEPAVDGHRRRHDPMASRGVPAHVTALHPFRPVVDEATSGCVADICRATARFTASFTSVERFPDGVVYLAPQPSEPFSALTRALAAEFPDCPPYGGRFPDPTPHLTLGTGMDESTARAVEQALLDHLPISSAVDQLSLLHEDERGMWSFDRAWPLAGG